MKTLFTNLLLAAVLLIPALATASTQATLQKTDTVIIKFGNNSQVVIYVEDADGIENIRKYDLNAMLDDLAVSIEEADAGTAYLTIEDENGRKYLRDTTITLTDPAPTNKGVHLDVEWGRSGKDDWPEGKDDDWRDGDPDDYGISFNRDGRRSKYARRDSKLRLRSRHSLNFDLGMNNYLEDGEFPDSNGQPYAVKPFGSWFFAINSTTRSHIGGKLFLDWGASVSWYNFKFDNPSVRIVKDEVNQTVAFPEEPATVNAQKSKLTAAYLNVQAVPMLNFSYKVKKDKDGQRYIRKMRRGFRIGAGPYAGYRIASYSKFVFDEDGDKEKDKDRSNFFLNNFRYGMRLQMGFRDIDIFVNYDMNELFAEGNGPQLNAFSFGIII